MFNPSDTFAGVYFHIPFCKKACHYCNFHFSTSLQHKNELVEALLKEIDITRGKNTRLITSVYFGGGTPSLLLRKELRAILEKTRSSFKLQPDVEISFEVNPDDMNDATVPFWKQQGINRLSIGIQSFRDEDLAWMNRAHTASQAFSAIALAKDSGFTNYSIDLIYGVPGLSDDAWKSNLQQAILLGVPHISAYALTVEPRTALDAMINKGKKEPVEPEQQARQFLILMEMMEQAGYEHYEISNFALPGMRSRHNSSYWQGIPYFGFGPSAHSYDGICRYWNISQNMEYIESLESGIIPYEKEELTAGQKLNEYIMTSLRTIEGIRITHVQDNWGVENAELLQKNSEKYMSRGMLTRVNNSIVLTREGKLFADGIAADLFQL
jgi:oxygen-independent coproporphyrinogen-3 oxidase